MVYVPINPGYVEAFPMNDPQYLESLGIKTAKDCLPAGRYSPEYSEYYVIGRQLVAPGSYAIWNDGKTQIARVMSRENFEAIYRPEFRVKPEDVVLEIDLENPRTEEPEDTADEADNSISDKEINE